MGHVRQFKRCTPCIQFKYCLDKFLIFARQRRGYWYKFPSFKIQTLCKPSNWFTAKLLVSIANHFYDRPMLPSLDWLPKEWSTFMSQIPSMSIENDLK